MSRWLRPCPRGRCLVWPSRCTGLVAGLLLTLLSVTSHASGPDLTPNRYTHIGLTLGWSWGGALGGPTVGFDATAGDGLGWLSLGSRVVVTPSGPIGLPYVEAGGWLVLTMGAGWTWVLGKAAYRGGPHLFVGTPLPTGLMPRRDAPLPCTEVTSGLFYRPFWARSALPGGATTVLHELSASVKCYAERVWGAAGHE
jgi:hypothetical protein